MNSAVIMNTGIHPLHEFISPLLHGNNNKAHLETKAVSVHHRARLAPPQVGWVLKTRRVPLPSTSLRHSTTSQRLDNRECSTKYSLRRSLLARNNLGP